jgi:hypothetical protein
LNSFTTIAAVALFVLASVGAHAQEISESPVCSEDVQAVVAAALRHALVEARDLPDLVMVEREDAVYFLNTLWENECLVDSAVLPDAGAHSYVLGSREDPLELAASLDSSIAYVRSGEVSVMDAEASLVLAVYIQQAPEDQRPLLCCCGGSVKFLRVDGAWRFQEWGPIYCS